VPAKYLVDPSTGEPIKDPNWWQTFVGDNGIISSINPSNKYYALYNSYGDRLRNEDQNTHGWYIVPRDYDVKAQIASAKLAGGKPYWLRTADLISYLYPGSYGDLQQTYDQSHYGDGFVRAFTDIGAYNYWRRG
jgi:hypothetical protein